MTKIRLVPPEECVSTTKTVKTVDECGTTTEVEICTGNEAAFPNDTPAGEPPAPDCATCGSPCVCKTASSGDCDIADDYASSLGVELQCDIDEARREAYHVLGLRPYRVFLTWRRRNRSLPPERSYAVIKRIELVPVNVVALDGTDLELTSVGLDAIGGITLTQISPAQVSDDDLRGKLDGADLKASEEEFFYEVVHRVFPGQTTPPRRRYILVSEPHHDGVGFMYTVNLAAQAENINEDGFTDDNLPPSRSRQRPELVS